LFRLFARDSADELREPIDYRQIDRNSHEKYWSTESKGVACARWHTGSGARQAPVRARRSSSW
jgi:hypothetical protein